MCFYVLSKLRGVDGFVCFQQECSNLASQSNGSGLGEPQERTLDRGAAREGEPDATSSSVGL